MASLGQPFQIESIVLDEQRRALTTVTPDTNSYFRLLAGNELFAITNVEALSLDATLETPTPVTDERAFYRVERISKTLPADSDGDGIDDVWEQENGRNGLLASDALQVVPGDTRTWLQYYYDQIPQVASFAASSSRALATAASSPVPVMFSKPFTGTLRVQLGGTALFGTDYAVSNVLLVSTNPPIFSLTVPNPTREALLHLVTKGVEHVHPDRSITLSLVAPVNGTYQLATNRPVTHVALMTQSSLPAGGLLAGTLATTNGVLLEPQVLRVALREGAGGVLEAYFDTARAPLFRSPFTLPVVQTSAGPQFQGAVSGTFPSNSVPTDSAHWTFSLPQSVTDSNGVITAQFQMSLVGLTATGRTNSALGTLTLAPLN